MALAAGARVGPYEIVAWLGAGGMGEVYRAKDTKLGRDIALKILPATFTNDPDRVARFRREAQVLASLNHPHIAQIHGLEDGADVQALVMELVEGPTLADRMVRGPIPLDEALLIAKQITEALEAAHEQGIVHRDLKPANIKVRPDGTVKVLDFGLARALDPDGTSNANATISPTLSVHATQAGVILGTAAYMAPEQARGKTVDRRADIWAFGVVLFEMLTGKRAFEGDDVSITLTSVLKSEPDWRALPGATPRGLRRLLSRCLRRDPKDRLQAIGDARIEIGELLGGAGDDGPTASAAATPGLRRGVGWAAAGATLATGVLVGALATWAVLHGRVTTKAEPMRFTVALPVRQGLMPVGDAQLALSPDGRHLVYTSPFGSNDSTLMMRAIDQIDAAPIKGAQGAHSAVLFP
jgi:hypothetical protein